jgi:acyl transferase domain-containing protein/acyl carrier protein
MTPLQRAVFALKETQARLAALEQQRDEAIAIVGMACRFPGGVTDPATYWRLLWDGVDAIRQTPPERWTMDAGGESGSATAGTTHARWGGFLEDIDQFDNHFFGISDREAALMDPQQRLLLELAWEALEDAGLPPGQLRGSRVGVFVGIGNSDYGFLLFQDPGQTDAYANTGVSPCIAANRISFAFDFSGPSCAIDTACSSSLVAIHAACQSIRNGDAEAALVAGANLMLSPVSTINLGKAGFLAADGRVRAFDAAASGFVRGEGVGVVVLKPLSAAIENADPIYAVIRGSAVNQNGASNGLTAPSRQAQERVLRAAYRRARVLPGQVQYVEAQGTGTPLGDVIEASALGSVLREGRSADQPCAIGSVKTNLGHLEAASGIASVIKVALALTHGQLPPTLHFRTPNPDIPFHELPLKVQTTQGRWPEVSGPRVAGVNAFGFGGSNAHVVLEQAPAPTGASVTNQATDDELRLLPLSACTEQALRALTQKYLEFFHASPPRWLDVCYTAGQRRDHHDCRLAVLAASHEEAAEQLEAYLAGEPRPATFAGRKPVNRDPKVAWLYSGQIDAWLPYGPQLARLVARLCGDWEAVDRALQQAAGWSLASMCDGREQWDDPQRARLAVIALQTALASWFRAVGVAPDVVLAEGIGHFAAANAAGLVTIEEMFELVVSEACNTSDLLNLLPTRSASLPFISAQNGHTSGGPDPSSMPASHSDARGLELPAAIASLHGRQVDCCLEMGPSILTQRLGHLATGDRDFSVLVSAVDQSGREAESALAALAALYAAGVNLDWRHLVPSDGGCVRLPTYAWQRQRLWAIARKPVLAATPTGVRSTGNEAATGMACETERDPSVSFGGPLEEGDVRPRPDLNTPYVAPRTRWEEEMGRAWSEILRVDPVGVHDSFFELGGDSLQATVLLNRLQEQLGEPIDPHVLFEAQTIDDLATLVQLRYPQAVARRYGTESPSSATTSTEQCLLEVTATADTILRLPRSSNTEEILSRLDELTDEEVNLLLQQTLADTETLNA